MTETQTRKALREWIDRQLDALPGFREELKRRVHARARDAAKRAEARRRAPPRG